MVQELESSQAILQSYCQVQHIICTYTTNSAGTGYGNDVQFTTSPVVIPSLTTNATISIAQTSAVSGGIITYDGGGSITSKGVCWTTTLNPTTGNSITTDGLGIAGFSSNLTGLIPVHTYHVRAYATNSAGTGYGDDVQFNTPHVKTPTLTTTSATSIDLTTAFQEEISLPMVVTL
jgi:hypothetical protein